MNMSIIPDWMKNAGDAISDTLDGGLDLVKDTSKGILDTTKKVQDVIKDNTWDVIHRPINTAIDFATLPTRIQQSTATVVDDYLFEDEKREIKEVENTFIENNATQLDIEEKKINQLQQEAEEAAKREIQRFLENQSNNENLNTQQNIKYTLNTIATPVQEEDISVISHNKTREV